MYTCLVQKGDESDLITYIWFTSKMEGFETNLPFYLYNLTPNFMILNIFHYITVTDFIHDSERNGIWKNNVWIFYP